MLVILLGSPGCGKGTLSEVLTNKKKFIHISTGNIFRDMISSGTKLGNKLKDLINKGNLVDDKTTWEVVEDTLKKIDIEKENVILDGYPRNIDQNIFLEKYLKDINFKNLKFVYFDVDDEVIKERISGRRVCKTCGKTYHILFNKPKVENKCDVDGGELYQRKDDLNIENRLDVYNKVTKPLVDLLNKEDRIISIDGNVDTKKIVKTFLKEIKK